MKRVVDFLSDLSIPSLLFRIQEYLGKNGSAYKSKIENPYCISYQSIYYVAVNLRRKPLTQFRPKFHFHTSPQPVY